MVFIVKNCLLQDNFFVSLRYLYTYKKNVL